MQTSDWITAALAALALVVAITSAIYARQAAQHARTSAEAETRTAAIEAERRREERRPSWSATIEPTGTGPGAPHRLVVELTTSETVDKVRVASPDVSRIAFAGDQEGVQTLGDEAFSVRPIRPGRQADAAWRVEIPQPSPGGAARLYITAWIGSDEWTSHVDAVLPPPPPRVSQANITRG